MNLTNYRLRLLIDVFNGIVVPSAFFKLLLVVFQWPLGALRLPAYIGFIFTWAIIKGAYSESRQRREAKSLGARPVPVVVGKWPGNVDLLIKMMKAFKTSYVLDVYRQLFEEYQTNTLNVRILWRDNIITMDQEHSKFILATGFPVFWRGIVQKERMELFFGAGIFNRDDEVWKQHRGIARPFFARERIADFEDFEKYCSRTLSILSSLSSSGTPCDAQDLYARLMLDAASEFLFGKNLDSLSADLPAAGKAALGPKGSATQDAWGSFARAFEMAQVNITTRGRLGAVWRLLEFFDDKNVEHVRVVRQFLDPLVALALADKVKRQEAGQTIPIESKNFLQHLAESTDDPSLICDQLLNMLLASRDTTATALTFITYFLAMHPDVTERLRAEVLDTCGPTAMPTFEQCRHMKYMRAVINETLRLYPPVPLNSRETRSSPCVFPPSDSTYPYSHEERPLYMPGGTTILYFPLLTQRNPVLWGEDADTFDPDRWIDPKRLARFTANPMMFTPFSAGPRICLGQNYAYNQLSYFLVRLLQRFDRFTLASECQPEGSIPPTEWKWRKGRQSFEQLWPAAALTLYVKGGLWVQFHEAST